MKNQKKLKSLKIAKMTLDACVTDPIGVSQTMLTKLTISDLPSNWGNGNSENRQNQHKQVLKFIKNLLHEITINKNV